MVVIRERVRSKPKTFRPHGFCEARTFRPAPTMCALADPHASMLIIMIRATKR